MKATRKILVPAILGALFVMAPSIARAEGSLDFGSSLSPKCLDPACLVVEFTLAVGGPVDGATEVDIFRLRRDLSSATWAFGSVIDIRTAADGYATNQLTPAEGGVGNWSSYIDSTGTLELAKSSGSQLPSPIRFTIAMASSPGGPPTGAQWNELTYTGQGVIVCDSGNTCGELNTTAEGTTVSFGGTITPEPTTVVLMATGLFGIGLVGLKRRREQA